MTPIVRARVRRSTHPWRLPLGVWLTIAAASGCVPSLSPVLCASDEDCPLDSICAHGVCALGDRPQANTGDSGVEGDSPHMDELDASMDDATEVDAGTVDAPDGSPGFTSDSEPPCDSCDSEASEVDDIDGSEGETASDDGRLALRASLALHEEHVALTWEPLPGVEFYAIERDGTVIDATTGTEYQDYGASPGNLPGAPVVRATEGTHISQVVVEWEPVPVSPGQQHAYRVIAHDANGPVEASTTIAGSRAGPEIEFYEIRQAPAGPWQRTQNTHFYALDTPQREFTWNRVIYAEYTDAFDAIELTWDEAHILPPIAVLFEVRAANANGYGPISPRARGYRGTGGRYNTAYGSNDVMYRYNYVGGGVVGSSNESRIRIDVPPSGQIQMVQVQVRSLGARMADSHFLAVWAPECTPLDACDSGLTCVRGRCVSPGFVPLPPIEYAFGPTIVQPYTESNESWLRLRLTRWAEIQATEVSQREWLRAMGQNPSAFFACGLDCPVESVSWHSAVEYANRMSVSAGLAPCYTLPDDCVGSAPLGTLVCESAIELVDATKPYECEGYRLPTEMEWEVAARSYVSGVQTPLGDFLVEGCDTTDPNLGQIATYCANSGVSWIGCERVIDGTPGTPDCIGPSPVGSRRAVNNGTHDMLGNVSEWVWDRYRTHPVFLATSEPYIDRVSAPHAAGPWQERGGHFGSSPRFARLTVRTRVDSPEGAPHRGFRLARSFQ